MTNGSLTARSHTLLVTARVHEGTIATSTNQLLVRRCRLEGRLVLFHVAVDRSNFVLHVLGKHPQVFQTGTGILGITTGQSLTDTLGVLHHRHGTIRAGSTGFDLHGHSILSGGIATLSDSLVILLGILVQLGQHLQVEQLLLSQLDLPNGSHLEKSVDALSSSHLRGQLSSSNVGHHSLIRCSLSQWVVGNS